MISGLSGPDFNASFSPLSFAPMNEAPVVVVSLDEEKRADLEELLQRNGIEVAQAESIEQFANEMNLAASRLVVLIGSIKNGQVLSFCRRMAESSASLVVLSEEADLVDRVIALEVGADDLLPWPANEREVLARVRAILRRMPRRAPSQRTTSALILDLSLRTLRSPAAGAVSVTALEISLLYLFSERKGGVVKLDEIAQLLRKRKKSGREVDYSSARTIVSRFRRKITTIAGDEALRCVRGVGYSLEVDLKIN